MTVFPDSAAAPHAPALAARLARRDADPYSLALELVASSLRKEFAHESD